MTEKTKHPEYSEHVLSRAKMGVKLPFFGRHLELKKRTYALSARNHEIEMLIEEKREDIRELEKNVRRMKSKMKERISEIEKENLEVNVKIVEKEVIKMRREIMTLEKELEENKLKLEELGWMESYAPYSFFERAALFFGSGALAAATAYLTTDAAIDALDSALDTSIYMGIPIGRALRYATSIISGVAAGGGVVKAILSPWRMERRFLKGLAYKILKERNIEPSIYHMRKAIWILSHDLPLTRDTMRKSRRLLRVLRDQWKGAKRVVVETMVEKKERKVTCIWHPNGEAIYLDKEGRVISIHSEIGVKRMYVGGKWEYIQWSSKTMEGYRRAAVPRTQLEKEVDRTERRMMDDLERVRKMISEGREPVIEARV